MDIEFIVQDVFALTRPQWKLASNLDEASRAFQLAVAQDQKTSGVDKAAEPADADSESDDGIDDGEAEADADAEANADAEVEESSESEDEAEVSLYPARNSSTSLISMKVDLSGDANAGSPSTDSEEETIVVTRQEEEVDPEDEADFEREYAKMMAESLDSRKHERKSTFDIPLPMRRKDRDLNTASDSWADETVSPNASSGGTVAFSLLTKRGNRQQVSSMLLFLKTIRNIDTWIDSHSRSTFGFHFRHRDENTSSR